MRASDWEFKNRAMIFGLVFGLSFPFYAIDPQNVTAAASNWLAPHLNANSDLVARILFCVATAVMNLAALLRTWASSFLLPDVVYASRVKSASLVADGPYRFVRNPLYLANVLMAFAMGALMSRIGFAVAVVAMFIFCYRLIFREESELAASQGASYDEFRRSVPRLLPALTPRVPSSGRPANWGAGFKAEAWFWGFALSILAFTVTYRLLWFYVFFIGSIVCFWLIPNRQKKQQSQ
jgi:protein-S-isoprenylcysteine O-methyltransferase Ste14